MFHPGYHHVLDESDLADVARWTPSALLPDANDHRLFPILPDHLKAAISPLGTRRTFEAGEKVFSHGAKKAPFFIVEDGHLVFFDRNQGRNPHEYFTQVFSGMFVGDTAMFTGEPTVAESRALTRSTVLEISHGQLLQFVRENSEAGDLILTTLMARRAWLEGHGFGQVQLIGPQSCTHTYTIRDFLGRNQIPFTWRDTEADPEVAQLLDRLEICTEHLPVLIVPGGVHRNPEVRELARAIGLRPDVDGQHFDVAIVGAGPGGLAAAVYAASEGLNAVVLDAEAPGGQAGTSSKIENYLGFTTGISGAELSKQGVLQARKFGATLCNPVRVTSLDCEGPEKVLTLDDGQSVSAHTVVLALGARYRRLGAEGCERFEGNGVYYAAGHLEAVHCKQKPAFVVGGGNSAGQAAVFLSRQASKVFVVIRRDSLIDTMSKYLIDRIEREPNIEILANTEIKQLDGELVLSSAVIETKGERKTVDCGAVFAMIGAEPQTDWLSDCCGLGKKGFIPTGRDAREHPRFATDWTADRAPYHLETTRPGIFAVGDLREGSIKRVATAVGEGSMVVAFAHKIIADQIAAETE